LVAFRAWQVARLDGLGEEAEGLGGGSDGGDGALVESGFGDYAAGTDVFATQFKLGLDEDEEVRAGRSARDYGGEDFGDGNEGDVGDDKRGRFGDIGGVKFAGIAFDADDARILLKFPVELIGVDVDREDFGGAVLEQAIGEAAVGGAEVEADLSGGIDSEIVKGPFEFEAATGDVFLNTAVNFDSDVVRYGVAGLGDGGAVNQDFAGEDHGLSFLAGGGEVASDDQLIQTELGHIREFGSV